MPNDPHGPIGPYKDQFTAIVLQHMQALPPDEWARLRARAIFGINKMTDDPVNPDATPEDMVRDSLSSAGMSLNDVIKSGWHKDSAVVIGQIANQPVYYVEGTGYYAWGIDEKTWPIWEASVSHPSYPEGW